MIVIRKCSDLNFGQSGSGFIYRCEKLLRCFKQSRVSFLNTFFCRETVLHLIVNLFIELKFNKGELSERLVGLRQGVFAQLLFNLVPPGATPDTYICNEVPVVPSDSAETFAGSS
ncbi:hypothetical protein EBR21_03500 [bacterium]|nr:hypothetical protein [bacterium]